MKSQQHQREMGATAACTIQLGEGTNQDNEISTVLMGDAWFGSVRAANEASKREMNAVLQIKSNHSLFPKDFIQESIKDAPGGSHIVLKTKHLDGDNDLVAVGYRYNAKVPLFLFSLKMQDQQKM